jgi:hypothetical protein
MGFVGPLDAAVANPLSPRRRLDGPLRFGGGDMDLGVRKVGKPADMVEVEVRDHDVAHVVSVEAQSFDLAGGRFLRVENRFNDVPRRSESPGICAILQPETGVDKDHTVVCFDQQHVAHQRGSGHIHRPAVEVMDLHRRGVLAFTARPP